MEKKTKHRLSDREKIEIVQRFFEERTSKTVFAEKHNLNLKSLSRWIKRFETIVQTKAQEVHKEEVSEPELMISISYIEFLELLKIKNKYDVMHLVLEA